MTKAQTSRIVLRHLETKNQVAEFKSQVFRVQIQVSEFKLQSSSHRCSLDFLVETVPRIYKPAAAVLRGMLIDLYVHNFPFI